MASSARYGSLPFDEQIAFFRQKVNVRTRAWTDLYASEHDIGFMVAGAAKAELLSDFRSAIDKASSQGTTLAEFRRDFDVIVKNHGWAYNGGRNWRTRVIYDTNLKTSYAAGREAQMADPDLRRRRPYGLYRHGGSDEPRPEHLAKDGMVVPLDSDWWETWTPPSAWGCSCKKFMVSADDVERLGLTITEDPPIGPMETKTVGIRGPSPRQVRVPKGVDPGFEYRPGAGAMELASRVGTKMTPDLSAAYAQAAAPILGRVLQREYDRWLEDAFKVGRSRGQVATVGLLLPVELAGLRARGVEPVRVDISLEDRLVVGRKGGRHAGAKGKTSRGRQRGPDGLTAEEWRQLPSMLAGRAAAYWDVEHQNILLVTPSLGEDRTLKVAVQPNFRLKGVTMNSVRTIFKINAQALEDRNTYIPIWGDE